MMKAISSSNALGRGPVQQSASRRRLVVAESTASVAPIKPAAIEQRELGSTGLQVPVIGVGAWSWGDRSGYWGYGKEYTKDASLEAYKALVEAGLTFIDTAEVYGFGLSEEAPSDPAPLVATKYAPQPWRFSADSVPAALRASLKRLQLDQIALYIQHWPGFALNAWSNDAYLEGLAQCVEQGLTKTVGVSNFNAERVRNAAKVLRARGTSLSSNQVQYSLLYRKPEQNGVFEACKESGVTLVAYSPLCQGLLTGKYTPSGPKPSGPRGPIYASKIAEVQPLIEVMRAVGKERGGKTPAQVALNWLIVKGALPIPGAKSAKQVQEIAGAVGWRLSDGEVAELEKAASKVKAPLGAPFENW